ncbi:uncharacterized protein LOC130523260 isoform X1 [Takifugu flavidus]|uniref:uncharacterized protein LOC130523260 isoform X1 n=1 Tax=Takifugu flavidus TaxID=433684 RepID=UPI00254425BB|nr:uncharacterized protein LOC130523260 isoform X1 [Takifugu flavidus]
MNVALLTAFAVSLLICEGKGSVSWADPGVTNPQPCQQENPGDPGYSYLVKKGLCGRVPVQSFIQATEAQVVQVCGTAGSRVVGGGNLCISKSEMKIYDVVSECSVKNVTVRRHKVVLACEKADVKVPCQEKSNISNYEQFVNRHVLNESFDRKDKEQWSRYLLNKSLCGRTFVQSFIEANESDVIEVCRTAGKRVENGRNLCISNSDMKVYDIISLRINENCYIIMLRERNGKVVLACNKVKDQCFPVHYQKWTNQKAGKVKCSNNPQ